MSSEANVTWAIEDWSGPNLGSIQVPYEIIGARHFFGGCVYTDFASQKPGVAFIKLSINDPSTGVSNFEKVFMVGWMQIQTPVLTGGGDVTAGDINCEVQLQVNASRQKVLDDPFRVCPWGMTRVSSSRPPSRARSRWTPTSRSGRSRPPGPARS